LHLLSRRRGWVVSVALLAVLCAVAVLLIGSDESETGGPLAPHFEPGYWYRIGGRMSPGDIYAYAGPTVENRTIEPAVLDSAEAAGLPASVRITRVTTLFPPRFSNGPYPFTGVNERFRSATFRALPGTVVPPGTPENPGVQEIVFFLSPSVPGVYVTSGVWVSYHIGAEHYRYFEPARWALCVRPATCPAWA
jgi:hypothetical protein